MSSAGGETRMMTDSGPILCEVSRSTMDETPLPRPYGPLATFDEHPTIPDLFADDPTEVDGLESRISPTGPR
jgi:hypothetical protein